MPWCNNCNVVNAAGWSPRRWVAGRVRGQTREMIGDEPYAYPTLEAREIYLWERYEDLYRYPPPFGPPYYDPWYYRHRRYGYPYR